MKPEDAGVLLDSLLLFKAFALPATAPRSSTTFSTTLYVDAIHVSLYTYRSISFGPR
jgi:hypothetical protein